jgi:hypothetical protein
MNFTFHSSEIVIAMYSEFDFVLVPIAPIPEKKDLSKNTSDSVDSLTSNLIPRHDSVRGPQDEATRNLAGMSKFAEFLKRFNRKKAFDQV